MEDKTLDVIEYLFSEIKSNVEYNKSFDESLKKIRDEKGNKYGRYYKEMEDLGFLKNKDEAIVKQNSKKIRKLLLKFYK